MKPHYYLIYQRGKQVYRTLPRWKSPSDAFQEFASGEMFAGTRLTDLKCMEWTPTKQFALKAITLLEGLPDSAALAGAIYRLTAAIFRGIPVPESAQPHKPKASSDSITVCPKCKETVVEGCLECPSSYALGYKEPDGDSPWPDGTISHTQFHKGQARRQREDNTKNQ